MAEKLKLDDSILDGVTGGNKFSNSSLTACSKCGKLTPSAELKNGVCTTCHSSNMITAVQKGTATSQGKVAAIKTSGGGDGIMMC